MDLGAILLLIALLLSVGLYLAAPLMRNHSRRVPQETQEVSSLMAERDRVINALQELDFDFKLGKIPEEDYPVQRAELLQMGTGVLKKLDQLTSAALDHRATRISFRESCRGPPGGSRLETELPQMTSQADGSDRRKARKTKSAGFTD